MLRHFPINQLFSKFNHSLFVNLTSNKISATFQKIKAKKNDLIRSLFINRVEPLMAYSARGDTSSVSADDVAAISVTCTLPIVASPSNSK